jgi:hypothetical protein
VSGFVLIHRQILDDTAFRSDAEAMAFAWLVLRASWKQTTVRYKDRSITLERGQLAMSVRDMAERLDRSKDWAKRFLDRLANRSMIATHTATGVNIITICNYDKYQASFDDAATPAATGPRQDRDRTATQNKEDNKGTRDIEPIGPISQRVQAREPKAVKETVKKVPMTPDWQPAPLPPTITAMTDLWPPGRLAREADQFRDYWLDRTDKRPGWDRTFHNRIRDIHDRVMKDNRNGNGTNYDRQPDFGTSDPVVQAILAGKAQRAGERERQSGDDAGSWTGEREGTASLF